MILKRLHETDMFITTTIRMINENGNKKRSQNNLFCEKCLKNLKEMKELKLKYSKIIPFPGFYACTIFDCVFRNPKYKNRPLSKITYNHESIHLQQQLDFVGGIEKLYILGGIIFYVWYFIE